MGGEKTNCFAVWQIFELEVFRQRPYRNNEAANTTMVKYNHTETFSLSKTRRLHKYANEGKNWGDLMIAASGYRPPSRRPTAS